MSEEVIIKAKCPDCGKDLTLSANIDSAQAPNVRSRLQPIGSIQVYKITSDQIKNFIVAKAKKYSPTARVDVIPRYTERKARKNEPHRSYASLRIAFSEDVVEKTEDLGIYGKIGDSADNVRFQKSIFQNLIKMYSYNPKDIDEWLHSYKNMEDLEEALGITENFINDIRQYATPQFVTTSDKEKWIIFSAAAENVIRDMLTDENTGNLPGRIQIQDVYQVSKDIVEFIVYLHPQQMKLKENPHVRQILLGEEKSKK
jgi:hypothetical protein